MSSKLPLALRTFAVPVLATVTLVGRTATGGSTNLAFPIGCIVFSFIVAAGVFWLRADPSRTARWQAWADAKAAEKKARQGG